MTRPRGQRGAPPSLPLPGFPGTHVLGPGGATAGDMQGAARPDHVHDGIAVITAGAGITVTGPPSAPIISATGGGGGGLTTDRFDVSGVAAQTLAALTPATVRFANVNEDPATGWNAGTWNWVAPVDGVYLVVATVGVSAVGAGQNCLCFLRVAGRTVGRAQASGTTTVYMTTSYRSYRGLVLAGSSISMSVQTDSGASPTVRNESEMSIIFLGN